MADLLLANDISIEITPPLGISIEMPDGVDLELSVVPFMGPPGPAGGDAFEYTMPNAQTTATVDHTLGRDPVSVQVFDESGVLCSGYGYTFTIPEQRIVLGFDIAVKATIRLL